MSKNSDAQWYCPFCSLLHANKLDRCTACGGWKCPSCHQYNAFNKGKCSLCHKPKPSFGVSPKHKKKKRKHKGKRVNPPQNDANIIQRDSITSPPGLSRVSKPSNNPPRYVSPRRHQKKSNPLFGSNNARSYQSKPKYKKPQRSKGKAPDRIQVTLSDQNRYKTHDNLSNHYSNASSHGEQTQTHRRRHSPPPNIATDYLDKNHANVGQLRSFGFSLQQIEIAWNLMKRNDKHKNIVPGNSMSFVQTMVDYMKRMGKTHAPVRAKEHCDSFTNRSYTSSSSYREQKSNEYVNDEERFRKNEYRTGDKVYFKGRKCDIVRVDHLIYTVQFMDNNAQESTKKMYLSWKPDIYNDELSVDETIEHMHGKWRYASDNAKETFYAPRHT
eukprot:201886_1